MAVATRLQSSILRLAAERVGLSSLAEVHAWHPAGLLSMEWRPQLQLQFGICRVRLLAVSASGRLQQWGL